MAGLHATKSTAVCGLDAGLDRFWLLYSIAAGCVEDGQCAEAKFSWLNEGRGRRRQGSAERGGGRPQLAGLPGVSTALHEEPARGANGSQLTAGASHAAG